MLWNVSSVAQCFTWQSERRYCFDFSIDYRSVCPMKISPLHDTAISDPFPCVVRRNCQRISLSFPGPVWRHREAHSVWPGAGGEVCQVREGEDRDRAELRQAAEVGQTPLCLTEPHWASPWLAESHCVSQSLCSRGWVRGIPVCVCACFRFFLF